jgi:hypothetical protein
VKAEPVGEAEQMAQENLVIGAGAQIVDERAVDLDRVDRQRLQMPQRGMPGAERDCQEFRARLSG